jgi:hypothetical protein
MKKILVLIIGLLISLAPLCNMAYTKIVIRPRPMQRERQDLSESAPMEFHKERSTQPTTEQKPEPLSNDEQIEFMKKMGLPVEKEQRSESSDSD